MSEALPAPSQARLALLRRESSPLLCCRATAESIPNRSTARPQRLVLSLRLLPRRLGRLPPRSSLAASAPAWPPCSKRCFVVVDQQCRSASSIDNAEASGGSVIQRDVVDTREAMRLFSILDLCALQGEVPCDVDFLGNFVNRNVARPASAALPCRGLQHLRTLASTTGRPP